MVIPASAVGRLRLDYVVRRVPVIIFNEHGMRLQEFPQPLVISEYSLRTVLCQHLSRIDNSKIRNSLVANRSVFQLPYNVQNENYVTKCYLLSD